jgi:F0F1-type ATP synthase delta subunit
MEFHEFAALTQIRQYQMVQETLERISVRIVTDEPLTDEQRTTFTRRVQQALGYDFDVNILDQRDDLPRLANGKFEAFKSKIA